MVEFDQERFFAAIDAKRSGQGLSWRRLAARLAVSASTFSRMARGHRPDVETFLRLVDWLGVAPSTYIRGDVRSASGPDTLTAISVALRGDGSLNREQADSLEEIVRVAYNHLRRR